VSKVYITNFNSDYDYSEAEKLGETVLMSSGYIPEYKLKSLEASFAIYALQSTEEDFLLLSGSNIVTAIAAAVWAKAGKGITFLQHGRKKNADGVMETAYISHNFYG